MKLNYKLIIDRPSTHQIQVIIEGKKEKSEKMLDFFLPRWSPGSYLMREYSRHLSKIHAVDSKGGPLPLEQIDVSLFRIHWPETNPENDDGHFSLSYSVYCHELTVRTSHIDLSHAFLHLPSLLMGVLNSEMTHPTLALEFPDFWTKVSTGLLNNSPNTRSFSYSAAHYDELIDSPIEIGNHETLEFMAFGAEHELAFYGPTFLHERNFEENLKEDIKKIVEHIAGHMGGVPYLKYTFITHFSMGLFGGLEHSNSTALQFCPAKLMDRKGYTNYLALVSHEYFHTWNVKRIRPFELGPFNYLKEANTNLLWLAEGLTSLMDELFIYRMGLITLSEYLEMQKENFSRYFSIPGKKFHSLNDSSYNAWIKLYRPDENSNNSTISYYLKGGIVFFALNILLKEKNKSIDDLLNLLWQDYQKNPERGLQEKQVFSMVESVGGKEIKEKFESMVSSTDEIDFDSLLAKAGLHFEWEKEEVPSLGIEAEFKAENVFIRSVILDGPGFIAGLNAGDEIIAINGMRINKDRFNDLSKILKANKTYKVMVSRLSVLTSIDVLVKGAPRKLKEIAVDDKKLVEKVLCFLIMPD